MELCRQSFWYYILMTLTVSCDIVYMILHALKNICTTFSCVSLDCSVETILSYSYGYDPAISSVSCHRIEMNHFLSHFLE